MPPRLAEEKRQSILDAIKSGAGWRSRNDIAKEFGVAGSTVGKIAEDEGIVDAFDRTQVARASEAKQVDNRARRAELSALLLEDSFRLRERMWQPAETILPNGQIITTELPVARDVRDFSASVQANVKTHLDVDKHDVGDQGAEDAKSMLLGVAEGLKAMYAASLMDAVPADPDE
jgi:transposase-like protein